MTGVEAFNMRRWGVQEAMEVLAKHQPAGVPVSPYVVVFVAQYLVTGRMPPTFDEDQGDGVVDVEIVDDEPVGGGRDA